MTRFIPLDDKLLYEQPQHIDGPIVPYQVGYTIELPEATNAGWTHPSPTQTRGSDDVGH